MRLDARWLDIAVVVLSAGLVGGAYLDARAQNYPGRLALGPGDEAVVDAAWLLLTGLLAVILVVNLRRGRPLAQALPGGHLATLAAAAVFGFASVVDVYWQAAFGSGHGAEALLSPPHLVQIVAGAVMVSGPLRAATARGETFATPGTLASAALLLAALEFVTQFAHPLVDLDAANPSRRLGSAPSWMYENLGTAALLIQVTLAAYVALLLLRRFQVRPGSLTLVVGLGSLPPLLLNNTWPLWPVAFIAGAVGDAALIVARRRGAAAGSPVGAALGTSYAAAYLGALQLTGGLSWPFALVAGAVCLTGLLGWLLGRLTLPASPVAAAQVTPASEAGWAPDAAEAAAQRQVKAALESLAEVDGQYRERLLAGITAMAASDNPRTSESGRLLLDYYVKRVGSHEVVMERLHLSRPTFYRRLQQGLELLAGQIPLT